jgi:hypothetical protein
MWKKRRAVVTVVGGVGARAALSPGNRIAVEFIAA